MARAQTESERHHRARSHCELNGFVDHRAPSHFEQLVILACRRRQLPADTIQLVRNHLLPRALTPRHPSMRPGPVACRAAEGPGPALQALGESFRAASNLAARRAKRCAEFSI